MTLNQYPDAELAALLRDNDEEAFTEIYNRYWKRLLTVAVNKTGSLEEAEEIVQDIFVSLWERRGRLELTTSLENYLAVSVKYRVIKAFAKKGREQKYLRHGLETADLADGATQEWLDFEELRAQLSTLVSRLPRKCRLVYRLSREAGYSQKQVAKEMGISEKTVEAHLGKALKLIRSGLHHFLSAMFL